MVISKCSKRSRCPSVGHCGRGMQRTGPTATALSCVIACAASGIIAQTACPAIGQASEHVFGSLIDSRGEAMQTLFRRVHRSGSSRDWPLRTDAADIGCVLSRPGSTVLIVVDGTPWALNDMTRQWVEAEHPKLELDGKTLPVRVAKGNPDWVAENPDLNGAKMPLAPLVDAARRMGCISRAR